VLITVKVFDQTHAPLVFALGEINPDDPAKNQNEVGEVRTAGDADATHFATRMAANATREHLAAEGIKSLSKDPRLAKLRFNDWFGKRLLNGTYDGAATKRPLSNVFGYDNYLGQFPSDVAIQVGLGVQPMDNIPVHQLFLGKMRKDLCDLAHFAALKGLVNSPLGITGFMMGENYDSNGSMLNNVVLSGLSAADNAKFDVSGRSLSQIVANIDQSLNDGFGDYRDKNSSNLTYVFDKLSIANPQRRSALLENREKVKSSIRQMKALGALERTPHIADPAAGIANRQAFFEGGTYVERAAQQEFLAQCAFVAENLKIDVLPYRNFSLFLNLNDLDGSNIDNPTNGSTSFRANSLNYVEGMRQLAMGLNMLARAISGKNALIVVVTDGGRSVNMGDGSGPGIAMLMGPKKSGHLDDALHGPMDKINSLDRTFLADLGNKSTGLPWTTGSSAANDVWGLCDNFGNRQTGMQVNMGDWQVGALQFMAEKQRRNVVAPELGRYVRFKRKA
jgi:hypothetical protein